MNEGVERQAPGKGANTADAPVTAGSLAGDIANRPHTKLSTGGSIGVSIVSNVLTHRTQFHQNRLVESVLPSSVQYQDTLHQTTNYFVAQAIRCSRRSSRRFSGSADPGFFPGLQPNYLDVFRQQDRKFAWSVLSGCDF
jgi:hypothetical protein